MDEPEYKATFEQISGISPAVVNICGAMPPHDPRSNEFRKEMGLKSPEERFNLSLNKVTTSIKDDINSRRKLEIFGRLVSDSGRCDMCKEVKRLASLNINVEYLNPLAFVVGYLAVLEGAIASPTVENKTQNIGKFNEIRSSMPDIDRVASALEFGKLTLIDILRYGRFLTNAGTGTARSTGCTDIRE